MMEKYRNSRGAKLAVFTGSLLLCLAAAELGLRLTGFAVTSSRQREFLPDEGLHHDDSFERFNPRREGDYLVLTFGDSLTNGGNVRSRQSYPYYLYQSFADAGRRAAVYNLGYCEDSTFGVALKLKNYLRTAGPERKPDAIVILVGAADLFNIPLLRARRLRDDAFWHDVPPGGGWYSLRLYKVYRHIRLSLATPRSVPGADRKTNEEKLALLRKVFEQLKHGGPLAPASARELRAAFGGDVQHGDFDFESVPDFLEMMSNYAGRVYTVRHRYDEFFALLLDMAVSLPRDFWPDLAVSDNTASYNLIQTYRVQSRFTAQEVRAALVKSKDMHPALAANEHFQHFMKLLEDREEMNEYVDRKRMEAWDEIARLAREQQITLILQNYPVVYKSANRIIGRVAEKHGLPLIDNRSRFGELIAKDGREAYLVDDDHLTPAGYEQLARGVYAALAGAKR
ncbi:MAG: GDSL-type esterase/lipase family protein [Elusimicrobiota bacterium]